MFQSAQAVLAFLWLKAPSSARGTGPASPSASPVGVLLGEEVPEPVLAGKGNDVSIILWLTSWRILARSNAALTGTIRPSPAPRAERNSLVYALEWDEHQRLDEWRTVLSETEDLRHIIPPRAG